MSEQPIETTVTLQWDILARCWRDKQTGVKVTGVPRWVSSAQREFAEREGIPLDRWNPVAPSQPNDDELTERLRGIARDEVTHFLAGHTARTNAYFCEPHKLATVGFVLEQNANDRYIGDEVYRLLRRIERLERPWWKRWFSR